MTRVLFVTAVRAYPAHGGERIHVAQVIKDLAALCELSVLAPALPADSNFRPPLRAWYDLAPLPRGFAQHLAATRFILQPQPAWLALLQRAIAESHAEIVWFNYGHWGQYAAAARHAGAITVMQTHNAQAQLTRQGLLQPPYNRWQLMTALRALFEARHEQRFFASFDHVLSVSPDDQAYHTRFVGPARSHFMPNYVDESSYNSTLVRSTKRVLMTGNFHAFQNQRGASWLLDRVWPLVRTAVPDATLHFAGVAPLRWQQQTARSTDTTVHGAVDDIVPLLAAAAVAVVPLQHGSGTRFKILEALAAQTPLVSTTLGAAGIALEDGRHARITDDAAGFADAIIDSLRRPAAAAARAAAGYQLLLNNFGRDANRRRLTQLVDRFVMNERRT